ncbi:hypothetical protein HDU92_002248 [Lobulomyces angularis]|nr:hypothetical protein HDU92_002248 [Lobulomyces angularis]
MNKIKPIFDLSDEELDNSRNVETTKFNYIHRRNVELPSTNKQLEVLEEQLRQAENSIKESEKQTLLYKNEAFYIRNKIDIIKGLKVEVKFESNSSLTNDKTFVKKKKLDNHSIPDEDTEIVGNSLYNQIEKNQQILNSFPSIIKANLANDVSKKFNSQQRQQQAPQKVEKYIFSKSQRLEDLSKEKIQPEVAATSKKREPAEDVIEFDEARGKKIKCPSEEVEVTSCYQRKGERLNNPSCSFLQKYFNRKPRCLLSYNPSFLKNSTNNLNDVLVTSSLDGVIQILDINTRCQIRTISQEMLLNCWTEEMQWVSEDTLCLISKENQASQIQLIYDAELKKNKLYSEFMFNHLSVKNNLPHDNSKGICSVCPIPLTNDEVGFVTGGNDRKMFKKNELNKIETKFLESNHTSAIQSLLYLKSKNFLISGGLDKKIIVKDFLTNSEYLNLKIEENINQMMNIKNNENSVIILTQSKTKQFQLFDTRQRKIISEFGSLEEKNLSKYHRFSIHQDGNLISIGAGKKNEIKIFDIRKIQTICEPVQKIVSHEEWIPRVSFISDRDLLVSISIDLKLGFCDYKLY